MVYVGRQFREKARTLIRHIYFRNAPKPLVLFHSFPSSAKGMLVDFVLHAVRQRRDLTGELDRQILP